MAMKELLLNNHITVFIKEDAGLTEQATKGPFRFTVETELACLFLAELELFVKLGIGVFTGTI